MYSLPASRNFSLRKALQMSLSAVSLAGMPARTPEGNPPANVRCSMRFVPLAADRAKFLSSRGKIARYTAAIALQITEDKLKIPAISVRPFGGALFYCSTPRLSLFYEHGSVISNIAPVSPLQASIFPPADCTADFAIARPRPKFPPFPL